MRFAVLSVLIAIAACAQAPAVPTSYTPPPAELAPAPQSPEYRTPHRVSAPKPPSTEEDAVDRAADALHRAQDAITNADRKSQ